MSRIDEARRHLRIDGYWDEDEIRQKLSQAAAIVRAYLGDVPATLLADADRWGYSDPNDPPLDPPMEDVPQVRHNEAIEAAELLILGELWANRESGTADPLTPAVKNILRLFKEPGYA